MNGEMLDSIKKLDFLEKKKYYEYNADVESVLVWGRHYDVDPMVTVVCPTYRRPDLLEIAIYSVLNQKGYDNYQMLIIDNEDVFDEETETEKLIKKINSDKIIYYRNRKNIGVYANWNRGMLLARSKYICIMNDDDVLMLNHLNVMMGTILCNEDIDMLGCIHQHMYLKNNPDLDVYKVMQPVDTSNMSVNKISYFDFNISFTYPILGSVMKKETFLDIGGIRTDYFIACEDYGFAIKLAYHSNFYVINKKLYGYYWGANLSLKPEIWEPSLVYEYYIYRSIALNRPKKVRKIFLKRSKYAIIDLVKRFNNGTSPSMVPCAIDPKVIVAETDIKHFRYFKPYKKYITHRARKLDYKYRYTD
ncbi:MAG: glycosyltransferase [Lachnospiraceae bacterium]|nr:glycosyltransferase [Lachnospiraceae bacterium]